MAHNRWSGKEIVTEDLTYHPRDVIYTYGEHKHQARVKALEVRLEKSRLDIELCELCDDIAVTLKTREYQAMRNNRTYNNDKDPLLYHL